MSSRWLWPPSSLRVVNGQIEPPLGQPGSPAGLSRIYLLVHGFNNDRYQAEASYEAFKARVHEVIPPYMLDRIWQFYWPGYEGLVPDAFRRRLKFARSLNAGLAAALYSKQVPKAVEFGEKLGQYLLGLRGLAGPTEIVLIGHSLGCRLILEAAAKMAGSGPEHRYQLPALCLMAAAVAVPRVEMGGTLHDATGFPTNRIVLYSRRDTVLHYTFRAGQAMAGEGVSEAVGLRGNPRARWTARDETMLKHGEYWSEPVTTPHILRLFGQKTGADLPGFPILSRGLPEPDPLPERVLLHR